MQVLIYLALYVGAVGLINIFFNVSCGLPVSLYISEMSKVNLYMPVCALSCLFFGLNKTWTRPGVSVWQQWSGLASVIVSCQQGCQLSTVLIFQAHRVFWAECLQNQVRPDFKKAKGQASLGMFFKNRQGKIEHAHCGHMGASGCYLRFVKLILRHSLISLLI